MEKVWSFDGTIKDNIPSLSDTTWEELNKVVLVSETISEKEAALIPTLIRSDMVGEVIDRQKLADFNAYLDLIQETPYYRLSIEDFDDLQSYYKDALKTAKYKIYRLYNEVGFKCKGIRPFTNGYCIVINMDSKFRLTYFDAIGYDREHESNWVFRIEGNTYDIKFDDKCNIEGFKLIVNVQAEPLNSICELNLAMEEQNWEEMASISRRIKDTIRLDGVDSVEHKNSILDDTCYDYDSYRKLVKSVNIEVTPSERLRTAAKFIEDVASEILVDYAATLYGIIFGHNRLRSKVDTNTGVRELINLGIKSGSIDVDKETKNIKVSYINEQAKKEKNLREDTYGAPSMMDTKNRVTITNTLERNYKVAEWQVGMQIRHYKKSGKTVVVAPFTCHRRKGDLSNLVGKKSVVTREVKQGYVDG